MTRDYENRLKLADLNQFCGSTEWYQHSLTPKAIYTEGVKYLAEHGSAYWLIDAIVSHLFTPAMKRAIANDDRLASLQFWRLEVADDQSAVLSCRADNGVAAAITQKIPFTDFPLDVIDIWCGFDGTRWTLYLPSEH